MTTLNTSNLSLGDVYHILGFQRQYNSSFTPLLSLETLTESEQQELVQIRDDFDNYLAESKVDERLVKVLTTFPLMRLAGFYRSPIKITLEEDIERINIEDEETVITGASLRCSCASQGGSPDRIFCPATRRAKLACPHKVFRFLKFSGTHPT